MTMTDDEKDDLVRRLVNLRYRDGHTKMARTTATPPINVFIQRPKGTMGQPVLTVRELADHRRAARKNKEVGELTTIATHPWDRRPDETSKAYAAFTTYRDLGPDRTMTEAMRILGKGDSVARTWNRQFQWAQRVRAYDEWTEKHDRRVTERARREMVERQARLGQTMTGIAQSSLDAGAIVPETVADVVRLAEAGTRIERLARGESTENVKTATALILAHPLPAWAPEAARQLVIENEFEGESKDERESPYGNDSHEGHKIIDGDARGIKIKTRSVHSHGRVSDSRTGMDRPAVEPESET